MSDAQPVRVLIVDDSEDQLMLLRRYFERAGCSVDIAATALDGLRSFDASAPDLTVIDLVLPGMDGWELAAQLRADNPDCAIAITSVLDEVDFPEYDAVLPKPVTGEHVRQVLRDHVAHWRES